MNIWLVSALILILLLFPAFISSIRHKLIDRLIGVELGGIIGTFIFILIGVGTGQTIYVDVAIVVALLSFGGGIVYTRFLERWL